MRGASGELASLGGSCLRGTGVLDAEYRDSILFLIKAIDDQHPTPRAEDESQSLISAMELSAYLPELAQRHERGANPRLGISREVVCPNELLEIRDGFKSQLEARQGLQLF